MVYALSKFISIPSISGAAQHKEDCRQAAVWLRKCLIQLGAQAQLVRTYLVPQFAQLEADNR